MYTDTVTDLTFDALSLDSSAHPASDFDAPHGIALAVSLGIAIWALIGCLLFV